MARRKTVIESVDKKESTEWLSKDCKVIRYDPNTYDLDIDFDSYGIRLKNVFGHIGSNVTISYSGRIGTADFKFKLKD